MASNKKSRETMQALIALLGQLDKPGILKAEALIMRMLSRANKRATLTAVRAKVRSPATGQ